MWTSFLQLAVLALSSCPSGSDSCSEPSGKDLVGALLKKTCFYTRKEHAKPTYRVAESSLNLRNQHYVRGLSLHVPLLLAGEIARIIPMQGPCYNRFHNVGVSID